MASNAKDVAGALTSGVSFQTGAFRYDVTNDRWWWSDEVYRMHGFEPGEVVPTTAMILAHKHPDDRERYAGALTSTSLLGGTLVVTPLLGADGEAYAVAQGPLSVSGFTAGGAAATVTKGVPTTARIANGATVERELKFALNDVGQVRMALRNPDFTTAIRIADAVNGRLGAGNARVVDLTTVDVRITGSYVGNISRLIGEIEQLPVRPDAIARVVVDERSGSIVIGDDVRVSRVAITQGNLTVRVVETPQVSQPQPFSNGSTVVVPRTDVQVQDGIGRQFVTVGGNVSLQQLVNGLNALGVGPRDMVAILQAIKAAGALHDDLEII